jgi:hypothetical protein
MVLDRAGRYLYAVDQGGFQLHVVDTSKIVTGVDSNNCVLEPNKFHSYQRRWTRSFRLNFAEGRKRFWNRRSSFQYKSSITSRAASVSSWM